MEDMLSRGEALYKAADLFYQKLFKDKHVQHFFVEFEQADSLEKHLQVLVDYLDGVLFDSGTYSMNAMQPHLEKNKKTFFEAKHFEKWMPLLMAPIDEQFKGLNAEVIKSRAQSIATMV